MGFFPLKISYRTSRTSSDSDHMRHMYILHNRREYHYNIEQILIWYLSCTIHTGLANHKTLVISRQFMIFFLSVKHSPTFKCSNSHPYLISPRPVDGIFHLDVCRFTSGERRSTLGNRGDMDTGVLKLLFFFFPYDLPNAVFVRFREDWKQSCGRMPSRVCLPPCR